MIECWNNVDVYGPQSEIDRFKDMCIGHGPAGGKEDDDLTIAFDQVWSARDTLKPTLPGGRSPYRNVQAWNFHHRVDLPPGSYSFKFDTGDRFPEDCFELVAELFPQLAFDCECITSDDDFMGFGWFNAPAGGEQFRQFIAVPSDYWTTGSGYKRTPSAEVRHQALLARLKDSHQGQQRV